MAEDRTTEAHSRQDPLMARYKTTPEEALITDAARAADGSVADPFHGVIVPGSQDYGVTTPYGIHRAVGGYHDIPNPGDFLCAALAACLDSTIRIIANRLRISINSLEVRVTARVDVRGTLMVDRTVPVGFQQMQCDVHIDAAEGTDPKLLKTLIAAAERSCVNLQTLRAGVPIQTVVHGG